MSARGYEGVVLAGYGETPVVKRTERDVLSLLAEAIREALASAGLGHDDVDGLAVGSFTLAPDRAVDVAERLGFRLRWLEQASPGGAGGLAAILHAARAVQAGDAEVVVCAAADVLTAASLRELSRDFNTVTRDYLSPYGHGGANGTFALLQARHMAERGTTREQLGRIAVVSRFHGSLDPRALLGSPIELAEYLDAPPVVVPLHLLDCVHPGSGGAAIVVTSAERARGVRIAGGAERHNGAEGLRFGWDELNEAVLAQARVGPADVDAVELYDDYPFMVLVQLEELGFCARGEGGAFLERTDLRFDGTLPLNTGGGMLARGQAGAAGGYVAPVEAIRQLRGEGGRRQVEGARRVLVSGLGMAGYTHPLSAALAVFSA